MASQRTHPAGGARATAAVLSLAAFGGLGLAFDLAAQEAVAPDTTPETTDDTTTDTATDATVDTTTDTTVDDWSPVTTTTGAAGSTSQSRTSGS